MYDNKKNVKIKITESMIKIIDKRNMISHEKKCEIKIVQPSIQQLNIKSRQNRTINHTKIMYNEIQSLLIERFGEYICKLIVCINKFK